MFNLLTSFWSWLTGQALHQLAVAIVALLAIFCVLLKYPIEFEWVTYQVHDNVTVTETTQYIVHTEASEDGAKLELTTKTYLVEVKKDD